ncbi:MAG: hypothetical protein ACI9OJ_000343 [Myxococcota bacterium]|jgi:hypothetical protein
MTFDRLPIAETIDDFVSFLNASPLGCALAVFPTAIAPGSGFSDPPVGGSSTQSACPVWKWTTAWYSHMPSPPAVMEPMSSYFQSLRPMCLSRSLQHAARSTATTTLLEGQPPNQVPVLSFPSACTARISNVYRPSGSRMLLGNTRRDPVSISSARAANGSSPLMATVYEIESSTVNSPEMAPSTMRSFGMSGEIIGHTVTFASVLPPHEFSTDTRCGPSVAFLSRVPATPNGSSEVLASIGSDFPPT